VCFTIGEADAVAFVVVLTMKTSLDWFVRGVCVFLLSCFFGILRQLGAEDVSACKMTSRFWV
jgi:hypothetical protein